MTVQQITYKWLNDLPLGYEFTGYEMKKSLNNQNGLNKMTATYLRMLRYYKADTSRIKCINRMKSLYKIIDNK